MVIDSVRVSQRAKDQLIKLKRITGIQQWNVLCRWGFCMSLAEPGVPPAAEFPLDSNVEMNWRVFGGPNADLYMALLKERMHRDGLGLDSETVYQQFRLHLHRGISYLANGHKIDGISSLISLALTSHEHQYDCSEAFAVREIQSNQKDSKVME